ncbi:MAG: hypothetical protein EBR20_06380 [Bacteroidetes bacterium]|nr:hypothetical protein [Bacteroidota bacterium]
MLEDIVIYDQAGAEVMFGHDGWLYKAEITQGDVQPFAAMPADTLFAPNTYPQYNSAVLTATHFWIWDSSVGTVVSTAISSSADKVWMTSVGNCIS